MSKPEVTFEQAVEKRDQIKNDLRTARKELVGFRKENNLKKDDATPKDAKIAAKLTKLTDAVTKLEEKLERSIEQVKELKPATQRQTQYTYPQVEGENKKMRDMTASEKKKFRAKARAEKKKADKPAKEEKAAKAGKEKTPPVEEGKTKKKVRPAPGENPEED